MAIDEDERGDEESDGDEEDDSTDTIDGDDTSEKMVWSSPERSGRDGSSRTDGTETESPPENERAELGNADEKESETEEEKGEFEGKGEEDERVDQEEQNEEDTNDERDGDDDRDDVFTVGVDGDDGGEEENDEKRDDPETDTEADVSDVGFETGDEVEDPADGLEAEFLAGDEEVEGQEEDPVVEKAENEPTEDGEEKDALRGEEVAGSQRGDDPEGESGDEDAMDVRDEEDGRDGEWADDEERSGETVHDEEGSEEGSEEEPRDGEDQAEDRPVVKGTYTWEHFKDEYYYNEAGNPPMEAEEVIPFEPAEYLGFEPEMLPSRITMGGDNAAHLADIIDERTLNVPPELDEDGFFSTVEGHTTITNRYDLEKAVLMKKKPHFREVERYWVNKPFAFVVIFHSEKENEKKYYLVEPHFTDVEADLQEFLTEKLRTAIKYAEDGVAVDTNDDERGTVIEDETRRLLDRYNLYTGPKAAESGFLDGIFESNPDSSNGGFSATLASIFGNEESEKNTSAEVPGPIRGIPARPEPVLEEEDDPDLTQYQVEKLLYRLKRDFVGYERIDGIKHDINVEDISCDGYNSPVFVYHTDYEQLITNVQHGSDRLDAFVVKMAQRAGKGISKRQPQVDATLPDGSRAQLTLGKEVSDHGTNYTIRQFKDVPFTPVDLINWKTFSLDEMAFLWLCIENNKSLLFAGGTASGKTTSLNAVSLFIPSNAKIVSIEDTREVELPQRNWIASITRPSFGDDEAGDIDEFDLLEAALRQRPDYIIMGEVRGEEGRTLFQVMSTGHTTYTTFHADNVSEVIKRFTTDPINVSKTLFTALDLVSIQAQTRIRGKKVRRSRNITEIRRYDAENDEINVNDVFQWRPETDSYLGTAESTTLDEIKFDRGWSDEELDRNLLERQVILAYLIENGLNTYTEVAATVQAYINDSDTVLTLLANDDLESALSDLREMESVLITVDPEKEEMVPRPDPGPDIVETAQSLLDRAESELFEEYRGSGATDIADVLTGPAEDDIVVGPDQSAPSGGTDGTGPETIANGTTDEESGNSESSFEDSEATEEL